MNTFDPIAELYKKIDQLEKRIKKLEGEKEKAPVINAKEFYRNEFSKSVKHAKGGAYHIFIGTMYNETYTNALDREATHITKLEKQLKFEDFLKLSEDAKKRGVKMIDMLNDMINTPKYTVGKKSIALILGSWIRKHDIQGTNHNIDFDLKLKTNIGN